MMKKFSMTGALSIAALSISMAFAAPADAVNQVKQNASQVLSILKKDTGGNSNQVRSEAERYAIPYFDFERMTALAVGAPWRGATPVQKTALTKEFQTLLIRTYSGTMLKFKNANVVVRDQPIVSKNGREITVKTEVSTGSGKPVKMDYTMYQSGNKYRVYNVSVEGASLVTVYRNQFGETIRKKGIDGLVAELKVKNGSK